jgi:hypothetical protein
MLSRGLFNALCARGYHLLLSLDDVDRLGAERLTRLVLIPGIPGEA